MPNEYGIPEEELKKIRERDTVCVYCHKIMLSTGSDGWRGDWATIEHLNILPPWSNPSTVAICCWSCNSSRGNKQLSVWFKTRYCTERNINEMTSAEPVRAYIVENPDFK